MRHILKILVLSALFSLGLAGGASAAMYQFHAVLNGANESPPTGSPGIGVADVFWDTSTQTMEVQVTFSGLIGDVTNSHIHCCLPSPFAAGNAGVATTTPTFPGFPSGVGVHSGVYDHFFDMTSASSYNPAFVTANASSVTNAMNALFFGLNNFETYLNIHSSVNAGGEIRGILFGVPEPASLTVMLGGLAMGAGFFARRRMVKRA